jgi:hypothetical protein
LVPKATPMPRCARRLTAGHLRKISGTPRAICFLPLLHCVGDARDGRSSPQVVQHFGNDCPLGDHREGGDTHSCVVSRNTRVDQLTPFGFPILLLGLGRNDPRLYSMGEPRRVKGCTHSLGFPHQWQARNKYCASTKTRTFSFSDTMVVLSN